MFIILYKRYSYDWDINRKITWWEIYYYEEYLKNAMQEHHFANVPDIDFDKRTYIVSFGRKIAEIRYWNQVDAYIGDYIALITFDAQYEESMAYIYVVDRITFAPSFLADSEVYMMINGERVFWGDLREINRLQAFP